MIMRTLSILLVIAPFIFSGVAAYANTAGIESLADCFAESDGDMTYEEGARDDVVSTDLIRIRKQKELEVQELANIAKGSKDVALSVTAYKQEKTYWCGPATVKQAIKYLSGYKDTDTPNKLRITDPHHSYYGNAWYDAKNEYNKDDMGYDARYSLIERDGDRFACMEFRDGQAFLNVWRFKSL